jgi:hypothetical protein
MILQKIKISSLTNQLVWVDKEFEVRPLEAYPNRSYNQDKQVVGLIRHLYVKYSCPYWMYDVLRKDFKQPYPKMHETYRAWFLALAQGRSFTKMVKPYMNAKEAYYFLNAPYTEIHKNFWWARLKHAGVDERQAKQLIERIFGSYFFNHPDDVLDEDGRLAEVVTFYANHGRALDKQDFDAVTDFVAWKLRNDVEFRFKGRTSTSMIGLSNEWHHSFINRRLPFVWRWLYFSNLVNFISLPLRVPLAKGNSQNLERIVNEFQPDCILSTQTTASAATASLIEQKKFTGKFIIAFSDFHLHKFWLYPQADFYLANIFRKYKDRLISMQRHY